MSSCANIQLLVSFLACKEVDDERGVSLRVHLNVCLLGLPGCNSPVSESTYEPLTSHLLTAPACCLVDLPGADENLLSVLAGGILAGFEFG